jgi:DNA-binding transcriptional ArsR family regulator
VSNHLACLRWFGLVATRREHRVIYYRLADQRVAAMLELADGLLADNADHVAACCRIPQA